METFKILERKRTTDFEKHDVSSLCNTVGMLIFLCLIIYFSIMRAISLHELFALRDINFIFLIGGILITLSAYSRMIKNKMDYFKGFCIGIRVTATAVLPFALFVYSYLITDDSFMRLLKAKLNAGELTCILGEFITPGIAAGIVCIEGLVSGGIITFMAMQYYKNK